MTQIEIDEESAEILQQLAAKSGKTDQELIVKAIHQLVLSHLRGTSTTKVNQNIQQEVAKVIISDKVESEIRSKAELENSKPAKAYDHNSHSFMTKGVMHLMHNKIFPVVYVICYLDQIIKSEKKKWVEIDSFKKNLTQKTINLSEKLEKSITLVKLSLGFPKSEERIERSIKRGWSNARKAEERRRMKDDSVKRFLDNYVGSVYEEGKYDNKVQTFDGAPAECGLIEARVESDGSEWITLTEAGQKLADHEFQFVKSLIKSPDYANEVFKYSKEEVVWIFKNIFSRFPIEEAAMKAMLKREKFGDHDPNYESDLVKKENGSPKKGRISGADEFKMLFHEHQYRFLKEAGNIENLDKLKENDYLIPKNRATATMSRLKELGLFEKPGNKKDLFTITQLGDEVSGEL